MTDTGRRYRVIAVRKEFRTLIDDIYKTGTEANTKYENLSNIVLWRALFGRRDGFSDWVLISFECQLEEMTV